MARIIAISSQVIYGPVGNTAAVPAMQSQGHDVLQIPTIVLSNHPGHGRPEGVLITAERIEAMLASLQSINALEALDAVMTGYFANADQVRAIAKSLQEWKARNAALAILVDPVIGDHGRLYVAEETAKAIKQHLLPLATITTPNLFELGWLTNRTISSHTEATAAARALGPGEVMVTSVPGPDKTIGTLLVTQDDELRSFEATRNLVPNGTGDFLAGLYLAHRLGEEPLSAFTKSLAMLNRAIKESVNSQVLAVAASLHGQDNSHRR
jgi:pyridoxine kinase